MTLAFLYNVRHVYPDPSDPRTQLETDFDDQSTIDHILRYLKKLYPSILPIEANEEAYLTLYKNRRKIDMVFNYSMGLHGDQKYGHLPAMLEMLKLPFTGSDSLTQSLILNKSRMKEILRANGLPTLPSQLFVTPHETLQKNLAFPLIVKPVAQGSSAGITAKSVVRTRAELKRQVKLIITTFRQAALVEPFLTWREFSVPMLGNPPKLLPIIEPNYAKLPKGFLPFDSLEVKWVYEEQSPTSHHLVCPANVSAPLKKRIETVAHGVWKALGLKDFCRIDMRTDSQNNLYVLDVNSPPGLMPPEASMTSYFPMSARAAGISYLALLKKVVEVAKRRYSLQGGR